jgi:hypothetical protein
MAAMLGFDACGIEIEQTLVAAAQQLADDFDLPAEFLHGSFIPPCQTPLLATAGEFSWLTNRPGLDHEDPGCRPEEFDVIFAFPWPDEEGLTEELFERCAGAGALLLTFHELHAPRLRRKETRGSHPDTRSQ